MARLLPYYLELKEKFNQDRFHGLAFKTLQLFTFHFLRDRSIFAIFGLEDLYQAETLTEVHFRDLDSWEWDCSMSKDLDCLDEIVNELDERGELDDLDEPDEQDRKEPCHPVAFIHEPIRSELLSLIRQSDLEAVKRVLDITPGTVDAEALRIAIKSCRLDILCQLLQHGAQVNGNDVSVPLCDAAKCGNKGAVQLLLSRGADIERGVGGWTPLTHAACKGHFEIVRYLVDEQGADVNGAGFECPLTYAIEKGHTRIVDYLLESGANVFKGRRPQFLRGYSSNKSYFEKDSPFFPSLSSSRSHSFPELFWGELLFSYCPEKLYTGSFKRLVADCCARTRYLLLSSAAEDGDLGLVEYLVSFGVDVNSTERESPLYRATKNRHFKIVRFLLAHATDVQPAGVSDLLWCAAENEDLDAICLLLGCGPRLDVTLLKTLLSVAGSFGNHYWVKAYGNAHDGSFICLPKDEPFVECDFRVSDSRDLGVKLLGAR